MLSSNSHKPILFVGGEIEFIRKISEYFEGSVIIDTADFFRCDADQYSKIIFSVKSLYSDRRVFECVEGLGDRCVFLSSIAVLSFIRRRQWALYPKLCQFGEELAYRNGIPIIRVAVESPHILARLPGLVAYSDAGFVANFIKGEKYKADSVSFCFEFKSGGVKSRRSRLVDFFDKLSLTFSNYLVFQLPIILLHKFIGSSFYGYTADSLFFFQERTVVGYGVLGSAISRFLKGYNLPHAILVSDGPDEILSDNGFIDSRIGRNPIGLAKFWHGVTIERDSKGEYRKRVPLYVRRAKEPLKVLKASVRSVQIQSDQVILYLNFPNVLKPVLFTKVCHLACGVLSNSQLLSNLSGAQIEVSDHEVAVVGYIDRHSVLDIGAIKSKFGIDFGRRVFRGSVENAEFMIEFRPYSRHIDAATTNNIFNNRIMTVIIKLIKAKSLESINQAFFNKFGFALRSGKYSIIVQVEAQNCIVSSISGSLIRQRLSRSVYDNIQVYLSNRYPGFCPSDSIISWDGIHYSGGVKVDELSCSIRNSMGKNLFVHGGIADGHKIGPFHNTIDLKDRELKLIRKRVS